MKERNQFIVKLVISHFLLLPGIVSLSFFLRNEWGLTIAISQTIAFIILLAGYWEFFPSKIKWGYFLVCEALIITSFFFRFLTDSIANKSVVMVVALLLIQLFVFDLLLHIIVVIFRKEKDSVEIEFPFKKGMYRITDGGNSKMSRLMNYHYHSKVHKQRKTNSSMLFATDIVKTDTISKRFLPRTNTDYPIFNEPVYSPMDGQVFSIVNNIPDNEPYQGNYPYNTGNTVIVKNGDYFFLLGHLKKGSITVKEGDTISKGQCIAQAGDSGYSERPHLHMQLIKSDTNNFWKGTGVNITFRNKNLFKNRIVYC